MKLSGDVFDYSSVENELLAIIDDEQYRLVFASYEFTDINNGTVKFFYTYNDNVTHIKTITCDIFTNSAININYESGHSKRVSAPGWYKYSAEALNIYPILDEITSSEEFVKGTSDTDYYFKINTYGYIRAIVYEGKISDSNNNPKIIYKKDFDKNTGDGSLSE